MICVRKWQDLSLIQTGNSSDRFIMLRDFYEKLLTGPEKIPLDLKTVFFCFAPPSPIGKNPIAKKSRKPCGGLRPVWQPEILSSSMSSVGLVMMPGRGKRTMVSGRRRAVVNRCRCNNRRGRHHHRCRSDNCRRNLQCVFDKSYNVGGKSDAVVIVMVSVVPGGCHGRKSEECGDSHNKCDFHSFHFSILSFLSVRLSAAPVLTI